MLFTEFYSLHAKQINHLLRNKSEMWRIGFKNGTISQHNDPLKKEPFLSHMAADYDIGFREGYSYALYKSFVKSEEEPIAEIPQPDITVGYVVQDYDFTFKGIDRSSLAARHKDIAYRVYPKKITADPATVRALRKEEDKVLAMMIYLRKHSRV